MSRTLTMGLAGMVSLMFVLLGVSHQIEPTVHARGCDDTQLCCRHRTGNTHVFIFVFNAPMTIAKMKESGARRPNTNDLQAKKHIFLTRTRHRVTAFIHLPC